jgi:hypothetical protein
MWGEPAHQLNGAYHAWKVWFSALELPLYFSQILRFAILWVSATLNKKQS